MRQIAVSVAAVAALIIAIPLMSTAQAPRAPGRWQYAYVA
jgi:hypothetical protein